MADKAFNELTTVDSVLGTDKIIVITDPAGTPVDKLFTLENLGVGRYDPDKPPASPSAYDDEFLGTSLDAGWTVFQASGMTVAVTGSVVILTSATHLGDKFQGIFKAMPAGDFTLIAKLSLNSYAPSTLAQAAIAFFEDATNNPNTCDLGYFGLVQASGVMYRGGEHYVQFDTYTSTIVLDSTDKKLLSRRQWIKVVKVGTSYSMYTSDSGMGGWYKVASGLSLGFTPAEIGLVVNNQNTGSDVVLVCDYFRVYTVEPIVMGID